MRTRRMGGARVRAMEQAGQARGPSAALLLTGALAVLAAPQAQAQQPAQFEIAAQPLAAALGAFGRQAGAQLLFDEAEVAGRRAQAVQGLLLPREALARLLAGSGVAIASERAGGFVLKAVAPAPAEGASGAALAPVTVKAQALADGTTEGSGSYTARSTATATGLPLSIRETPQSVSVITRQRMDDQGLTQLTDVAAQTAGLVVAQGGNVGSDSSPIYARGFSVDNYMIDGVKMLESYSSIFQSQDMALYDRVEIVRGATGLMNGSGTASAAINMVRKKPTRAFQAAARVEAGSWDYYRADLDVGGPLNAAGSLRGRLVAARQDAKSYIDRLQEDRTVLYGVLEADLAPHTLLRAGLSEQRHDATGHARGGLPAYYSDGTRTHWARSDSAAPSWSYSKRHSTSGFVELDRAFDNGWELKATAMRTVTFSDELVGYASAGNPVRETGAGVGIWATHWEYEPRQNVLALQAKGSFGLFGREHDLVVGATHARTQRSSPSYTNWTHAGWSNAIDNIYTWDGSDPAAPPNPAVGTHTMDERNNSAFASVRLRATDALSLIVGARVTDWRRGTDTSLLRETGEVTPYAGLVVDLGEHWSAYASYTTIFQAQSQKAVDGSYLDPLMGNSRELGIKGAFFDDRLNFSAAVYETQEDNKAVAITDTFAPDGSQAYAALSGTRSRGFELELAGQLARGWEVSTSFARNQTRDRLGAPLNTNVPQSVAKLYTSYRLPDVGHGLVVGGGLRWQNRIYTDNLGPARARFVQGSYAVVDLMARYAVTPRLQVSVNLQNLFDKWYYTNTGNSYYGAPRSVRVALDLRY
ncbi:MAG: TonB-dependent siderophore receptor [Pseudorhodoferax sp.]